MRLTVPRSFLVRFIPTRSTYTTIVAYDETYGMCASDSSILPEELASQSVRLKEEQLRREEEKVTFSAERSRGIN